MNCETSRSETMHLLQSIISNKEARMRGPAELKKEIGEQMHELHENRESMKKHLMEDLMREKMALTTKVNSMLSGFNNEQHEVKKFLANKAKALHISMKKVELDRVHEFKTFHKQLEQEQKERHIKTTNELMKTQQFMTQCRKHHEQVSEELKSQFSESRKVRHEILAIWGNMSSEAPERHAHMKPHAHDHSNANHAHESSNANENGSEADSGNKDMPMNDLLMKVKAVVSGFHEGCKFSELHRALDEVSKSSAREAINSLLASKEIRKDENDRFHLI
jgi:hypothetical protein